MSRLQQVNLWFAMQPKAVGRLLQLHLAGFVLFFIAGILRLDGYLQTLFLSSTISIQSLWALPLHSFVHPASSFGTFLSSVFDILWFFWVAKNYEELYGKAKTYKLYLIFMFAAVSTHLIAGFFGFNGWLFSVMPITLGFMMLFYRQFPQTKFNLFGVVNLPYWVIIAFLSLSEYFEGVAPYAIFGPLAVGYFWQNLEQQSFRLPAKSSPLNLKKQEKVPIYQTSSKTTHLRKEQPSFASDADELDYLLDKISAKGYPNLSTSEKKRLEELSQ